MERRKCYAIITKSCDELLSFKQHMKNYEGIINGLSVKIDENHSCQPLQSNYSFRKAGLKLKYLKICASPCQQSANLMEQIVLGSSMSLAELSITYSVS